jgi:hypothetical protein
MRVELRNLDMNKETPITQGLWNSGSASLGPQISLGGENCRPLAQVGL